MSSFLTSGKHALLDVNGVAAELLNDRDRLTDLLVDAAHRAGATVIGHHFYQFDPQGVTGVVILSESHITIHTYPEHGYCSVDCYTCGSHTDPEAACRWLVEALGVTGNVLRCLSRGLDIISD